MGQVNDSKFANLTGKGFVGSLQDMERDWLLSVVTTPNGITINDLWYRYMVEQGETPTHLNDMFFSWLRGQGFTGALGDMWHEYWEISTVLGASFDGTNDFLTRGADLDGNVDGKQGIFAARIRFNSGDGIQQRLVFSGGGFFDIQRTAANDLQISAFNSAVSLIMNVRTTTNSVRVQDGYVAILGAWDLAAGTIQLYLNDVDDTNIITNVNDNINYTNTQYTFLGRDNATGLADVDCTFFYLNTAEYIDISIPATRRLIFNLDGTPAMSPTGNGSELTGTQPIVYLAGDFAQWENNKGSGGGMTVTGALTQPID